MTSFETRSVGSQNDYDSTFHRRYKWIKRGLRQLRSMSNELKLFSENVGEKISLSLHDMINNRMGELESSTNFYDSKRDRLIGNDPSMHLEQFRSSFQRLYRVCRLIPEHTLGNELSKRLEKLVELLEKTEKCVRHVQSEVLKYSCWLSNHS